MYLGLRKGEALAIEWKDIDFSKGCVYIHRNSQYRNSSTGVYTTTPKTNSSNRNLELPKEILDLLPLLKSEQENNKSKCGGLWVESDRVFCNWCGKPLFPSEPYNYLKNFCKRENLPFKSLHAFRHSLVTNLIHNGIDIATVSNIVGHSTPLCTLSIYTHEIKQATAIGCGVMSKLLAHGRENNEQIMS